MAAAQPAPEVDKRDLGAITFGKPSQVGGGERGGM
jgi:hypothetical protein